MQSGNAELTESDVAKIQAEIEDRKLNIRKQLIAEVKEARAQGDLSENFEYYAAKKAKNENEGRINYLEKMLKTARVISDKSKDDEVGMNNRVEVFFEEDGTTETYKIVTSIRGNSLKNMISNESPIGRALMGRKAGDRIRIKVNSNYSYYIVIKSIDKTSDDTDDEIKKF